MSDIKNILVLGAGELGTQVLLSLAKHPNLKNIIITALLRPSSISSKDQDKARHISMLYDQNILNVPWRSHE